MVKNRMPEGKSIKLTFDQRLCKNGSLLELKNICKKNILNFILNMSHSDKK